MSKRHLLELFVIDAMADDYEHLENIEKSVKLRASQCGVPFSMSEVTHILQRLIANGFVKTYRFALKPDDVVKQFPFRGIVTGLEDRSRVVKIHLDEFQFGSRPFIIERPVKDRAEYARLKIGDRVRGVVFARSSDFWIGDLHEDDGDRSSVTVPFDDPIEVPGVPGDDQLRELYYGLSPKGREVQDSDAPGWPFDDNDRLIPGWRLEED